MDVTGGASLTRRVPTTSFLTVMWRLRYLAPVAADTGWIFPRENEAWSPPPTRHDERRFAAVEA